MRKIQAFLFLISLSIISSAEAKVCFLPGVFGGDTSCLSDAQYANCEGFDQTTPCPEGQEQVSCVKGGKTYYRCYCRADTYKLEEHPEYLCTEGNTTECGCAAKHLKCSPEYKYEGDGLGHCKDYKNTVGVNACVLPNGKTFYKDCICSDEYQYFCHETGLREPLDERYMCEDPSGVKSYKGCECDVANGWSSNGCRDRLDGCTEPMTYIDTVDVNGNNIRCSQCEEYVCATIDEFNVLAYFCAKSTEVNFDCEDLGYVYAPSGTCPADSGNPGEVGVRCPFNRDYMNCERPENCYPNLFTCEEANPGAVCELIEGSEAGCYGVVRCDEVNGYRQNGTRCEAIPCAAGYRAGLTTCTKEGETYERGGMSGGEVCGKCVCSPNENCVYTAQPNDHSTITINNNLYQPIYAGTGELANQCCNGYYSACIGRCSGRDLNTDPDPNMEAYDVCEACGEKYYVIRTCKKGYEVRENRCEASACNVEEGYSTDISGTMDCMTSENMFQGAYGWTVETQTDVNGNTVQSGEANCNRCVCGEPETPSEGDLCRWNSTNKGANGVLKAEDLCCNGYYKDCFSEAPEGSTPEACDDEKATVKDEYEACDFQKVCFIRECQEGYRVQNNRCVTADCRAPYTTSNQAVSDCGTEVGWNLEYDEYENGNRARSGSFYCTQCVCEAPQNPSETDACRWNKNNKGSADLSDVCCNGYYATCATKCVGLAKDALTEPAGKFDIAVSDALECTGCGETLYRAKACKTENGYDRVGDKCVHTGCAEGYDVNLTPSGCASGFEYVTDPDRTDEGRACGKCEPKGCEEGYALDGDLDSCTNSVANSIVYWALGSEQGTPSGENACYKCKAVTCEEMGGQVNLDPETQYPSAVTKYYNTSTNTLEDCYLGVVDKTPDELCEQKYGAEYKAYTPDARCVTSVLTLTNDGECYYCASCASKTNEAYYPTKTLCEQNGYYKCDVDPLTGCYVITSCGSSYYENNCSKKTPHGNDGWGWTEVTPLASITPAYVLPKCGTCTPLACEEDFATNVTCNEGEYRSCSDRRYAGEEDCCRCPCDVTHRTSVEECGDTGSAGWYFEPSDTNRCKLCVAKTCQYVNNAYQGVPCSSGYDQTNHTVTLGDNTNATCYECVEKTGCPIGEAVSAAECGNGIAGASGWTIGTTPTGNKVGEADCYECFAKTCAPGDATVVANCGNGTGGANGWHLGTAVSSYNGDTPCYNCLANSSCPAGQILDGGDCGAGYEQGLPTSNFVGDQQCYACKVKDCTTGATTEANCGNGSGGANGWKLGNPTGEMSGTQQCKQCVAKQCSDHNSNYYPVGGCPAGYKTSVTHNNLYLGDTLSNCVECQESGCNEGYATDNNGCGTGRIIDMAQPGNQTGGQICYKCICDMANGYYDGCPNGAECQTQKVNGCSVPTGCHEGYITSLSSELEYFNHTTAYKFNVGSTQVDCHTINGCKSSVAVPLEDINQTMFTTTCHTIESTTCCEINGCQSGYTLNTPCTGETTATETDTLLGKTCRKCEGCVDIFGEGAKTSKEDDENCSEQNYGSFTCYYNCGQISCATQGYYELSDTKCDRSLKNVTTSLGTTCKTGDNCYADATHGYYYQATQIQNYFTYGEPNECGKAVNDPLYCYKNTGCNRDANSTCWSSNTSTNNTCKQEIATKYSIPVSALTFEKKTQGGTSCNVLKGCAQTTYDSNAYTCSSKTVNGQTCYYNCEPKACPSGYGINDAACGAGYVANTSSPHATAKNGENACYKCENCAMRHPCGTTSTTEPSPASDYSFGHETLNGVECYYDIVKLSCSTIGAFDECPAGFSCAPYNDDCVSVTGCDTTNGYTTTPCSSTTQVELFNETKGGTHCYKCRNKTCQERYTDGTTTKPTAGYNYSQTTIDGQPCYYNITPKTCQNGVSASVQEDCPAGYALHDSDEPVSYAGNVPCYPCVSCEDMGGSLTDLSNGNTEGWSCAQDVYNGVTCHYCVMNACDPAGGYDYATSSAECGTGYMIGTQTNGMSGDDYCYRCEDCAARHSGKLTWTSQPNTNVYYVEGDEDVNGVHCWWGREKTCVERGYYSSCPADRTCTTVSGTSCLIGSACKLSAGYVSEADEQEWFTYTPSTYNGTAANDPLECYKVTGCDASANSFTSVAALASHFGIPQSAITYTTKTQDGQTCYVLTGCAATSAPGAGYTCDTKVVNGQTCYYNCVESGCQPGSATSTDGCPVGSIIDTSAPTNMAGETQCYDCVECKEIGGETDNPGDGFDCDVDDDFHGVTCYTNCEESSCPPGSATSSSGCGTGRVLSGTNNGSYAGYDPCEDCVCDESQGYYAGSCPFGASCTTVNGCFKTTGCADGWYDIATDGLWYFYGYHHQGGSAGTFNLNGSSKTCVNPGPCATDDGTSTGTAPSTTIKNRFTYDSKTLNGVTCYYPTGCKGSYENLNGSTCVAAHGNYYEQTAATTWVNMTCTLCSQMDCQDIDEDYYETGDCPAAFLCQAVSNPSWCVTPYACNGSEDFYSTPCDPSTQIQQGHQQTADGSVDCYMCQDKDCSAIHPGGTTTRPGTYCTYDGPETINGQDCYWNVEPTYCDESLYPYNSDNLPANSDPTGTPCIVGNSYCEEEEKRWPGFTCKTGYYYKEEEGDCVEKDCEFFELYDTCNKSYSCETCPTTTRNNGLRTITCYTGEVSQDNCKTTCEEYTASNGRQYYSSNQTDMTCGSGTVRNDIGVDMTCWSCSPVACTPSCPSNMMDDDSYEQDYACQTSVSHTVDDGCGGTITCYTVSNENCRTSCDDYGYQESIADGYTCRSIGVTTDLGEQIDCYTNCTPIGGNNEGCDSCYTTCEDNEGRYCNTGSTVGNESNCYDMALCIMACNQDNNCSYNYCEYCSWGCELDYAQYCSQGGIQECEQMARCLGECNSLGCNYDLYPHGHGW